MECADSWNSWNPLLVHTHTHTHTYVHTHTHTHTHTYTAVLRDRGDSAEIRSEWSNRISPDKAESQWSCALPVSKSIFSNIDIALPAYGTPPPMTPTPLLDMGTNWLEWLTQEYGPQQVRRWVRNACYPTRDGHLVARVHQRSLAHVILLVHIPWLHTLTTSMLCATA